MCGRAIARASKPSNLSGRGGPKDRSHSAPRPQCRARNPSEGAAASPFKAAADPMSLSERAAVPMSRSKRVRGREASPFQAAADPMSLSPRAGVIMSRSKSGREARPHHLFRPRPPQCRSLNKRARLQYARGAFYAAAAPTLRSKPVRVGAASPFQAGRPQSRSLN
jgi:hypothetical protein